MLYSIHCLISDHVAIDNYYYLLLLCKAWVKTERYSCTDHIKIENNEFRKVCIKNHTCYYFDDIIKLGDFHFDNILIDD